MTDTSTPNPPTNLQASMPHPQKISGTPSAVHSSIFNPPADPQGVTILRRLADMPHHMEASNTSSAAISTTQNPPHAIEAGHWKLHIHGADIHLYNKHRRMTLADLQVDKDPPKECVAHFERIQQALAVSFNMGQLSMEFNHLINVYDAPLTVIHRDESYILSRISYCEEDRCSVKLGVYRSHWTYAIPATYSECIFEPVVLTAQFGGTYWFEDGGGKVILVARSRGTAPPSDVFSSLVCGDQKPTKVLAPWMPGEEEVVAMASLRIHADTEIDPTYHDIEVSYGVSRNWVKLSHLKVYNPNVNLNDTQNSIAEFLGRTSSLILKFPAWAEDDVKTVFNHYVDKMLLESVGLGLLDVNRSETSSIVDQDG
ncbi:uncharacterized protein LY89DRAFT_784140 [Mollisia scopiformis]|uniref:Uncharacterized protein n=1 Tax=Mollisia scopiformis TaxID=149040 RepID=A0A194X2S1_MOLSC|nr:uncharacterized protein LY89DRAFT_784140 [Mollisia scopiformis]KUJ14142.1 hypothetical protein LY89DRAFT_784140 [Mollisia scopiformis]